MKITRKWLFICVLILSGIVRFYDYGQIPSGVYVDEALQGYNAYSMLKTGKDQYGKSWPIMTKLFGTYSSSLYTYISVVPVNIFGLNASSVRAVSTLSGIILVWLTLVYFGVIAGLVVAIAPVFVFFSRAAFESNLGLTLLLSGILISISAERRPKLIIPGFLLLALSGYAYHAERFLSIFFLLYFVAVFRKKYTNNLHVLLTAVVVAVIIQLPLWRVSLNPNVNSRMNELMTQGSFSQQVIGFTRQYVSYFSPNNLFSRPDPDTQRSFPDISVFYPWMVIPFLIGIVEIFSKISTYGLKEKTLLMLLFVGVIPGAITKDYFSTIRVLPAFFVIAWIIASGWQRMLGKRKVISVFLIFISCLGLYSNLVLLKHERSNIWGFPFKELSTYLSQEQSKPVVIDNSRSKPIYILLAFYNQYDPKLLQSQYSDLWLKNYYNHPEFEDETQIKNIEIRPITWETDIYKEQILIGDTLSISDEQSHTHKLTLIKEIGDINGETVFRVFQTNPKEKCLEEMKNNQTVVNEACHYKVSSIIE